jgi:transcriptional regulator with XRE-family HTH domain
MIVNMQLTLTQRVLLAYDELKKRNLVKSKSAFAQAGGFLQQHWTGYEKGSRRISLDTATTIANHFGLSLPYLLQGEGELFNQVKPGYNLSTAAILGPPEDLDYINLPFVPFTAYGSFISGCHEDRDMSDFSTYKVLRRAGKEYKNAVVIEVRGNSMAPRYPDQSCHVARRVSDGNWQYATGVHALSLRSEMFVIKKITSNINGVLTLTGTATGDTMSVELGDINCMWKVGEAVYMPEEE